MPGIRHFLSQGMSRLIGNSQIARSYNKLYMECFKHLESYLLSQIYSFIKYNNLTGSRQFILAIIFYRKEFGAIIGAIIFYGKEFGAIMDGHIQISQYTISG